MCEKTLSKTEESQVWWHIPVIPALGKLRQKDQEFEASLGYTMSSSQLELHRETLSQKTKTKK
jgi:hypothetical protein